MGFDLSGVKIENTSDKTGLFHTISNASIENINLKDFVITGRSIIGSLASTVNGNTNIKSVNIINSEIFSTLPRVGGYFGLVDTANLRLIDSDIVVNISSSSLRIGGITGEALNSNIEIKNLSASGLIETSFSGNSFLGGLIGDIKSDNISNPKKLTLTSIYSDLDIITINSTLIGGVIGQVKFMNSYLENISSTSIVAGSSSSTNNRDFGGIIGKAEASNIILNQITRAGLISSGSRKEGLIGTTVIAPGNAASFEILIQNTYITSTFNNSTVRGNIIGFAYNDFTLTGSTNFVLTNDNFGLIEENVFKSVNFDTILISP